MAWFELTREPVSPAATFSAGSHLEHSSHDRHTRRATRERCVRSVSVSSCRSLRRLCLLFTTSSAATSLERHDQLVAACHRAAEAVPGGCSVATPTHPAHAVSLPIHSGLRPVGAVHGQSSGPLLSTATIQVDPSGTPCPSPIRRIVHPTGVTLSLESRMEPSACTDSWWDVPVATSPSWSLLSARPRTRPRWPRQ